MMETTTHRSVRRVSFSEIDTFPSLFQDYCTRYELLSDYFAGDFRDVDVRRAAVERAVEVERDRDALCDVLLDQNERWGLDERARANVEMLRSPDSAAVVTGQQVGIFTGPLFTCLKAISTLQLAEKLSLETSRPIVPIFWLGAEDHDFEEIARVFLLKGSEPVEVRYRREATGAPRAAGRIRMNEEIVRLIDQVDATLVPSDFKEDVMGLLRASYRPGETFADAFARMLRSLFPDSGMVIMNPDDVRLKRMAAPLFRHEIEDSDGMARAIRELSPTLGARYHEQVRARDANLFLLDDRGRYALDAENSAYHLRDRSQTFSIPELLAMLDRSPDRFSPNVVLRPLMQDLLLPTAMYVGGPGEISYFAQYRPAYEWAGVPMPLIYPRASVTIVESRVGSVLDRYGLDVPDFEDELDRLFRRVVLEEMEVDVEALFRESGRHLHEAINTMKDRLVQVDRTLVKSAEATRAALMAELDHFKSRVVRAERRKRDEVRGRLRKAQASLFPGGILQERALSVLVFANKYSLDFVNELRTVVSTDTTEHQVITL